MKILNAYAGIGGNRKLWGNNHDITAVELNPEIANIYKYSFPNDNVIVADAHEYLLEHFQEYEFIWASPPCQTHSRMNKNFNRIKYADMKLYQEIILLQNWFKGKYCVENVWSYYEPLIKPKIRNRHYYWCNFVVEETTKKNPTKEIHNIIAQNTKSKRKRNNYDGSIVNQTLKTGFFDISKFNIKTARKDQILRNCVNPEEGLYILNCVLVPGFKNANEIQQSLF
jgi:DNA (cytosine-5)-methyltransferase 1